LHETFKGFLGMLLSFINHWHNNKKGTLSKQHFLNVLRTLLA